MILTQPSIDPVLFSFGIIDIRWYSLAYIAAFLLGITLIKVLNKRINNNINNKNIDDFFIWAILGVILGGRIGYVIFYQIENLLLNPLYLFYIWKGGMSFHGGLLGMIVSIIIFSKIKKINFYAIADLVSVVAPTGIFFGRIANFINVELIGRPTNFSFAIIYPSIDNIPRHPSQLYEGFFEGIILFLILLILIIKKKNIVSHGYFSGIFLLFYGIFRFFIEFLREPDNNIGLFFNFISMGQVLCLPLIFFGLILFIKKKNV